MKLAVILASIAAAIRSVVHQLGHSTEGKHFMFLHLSLILLAVFFSIKTMYRREGAGFIQLLRAGMRATGVYALLTALFIFLFYNMMDTATFPEKVERLVATAIDEGHAEEEARDRFGRFFTPFNYTTITFIGLLMMGALYSVLITLLHTKVLPMLKR